MIETKILSEDPFVIYHRVSDFAKEEETRKGVETAIEVIKEITKDNDKFNIILDFRGLPDSESEYNMAAHRIWAVGFKEHETVKKNVKKTAVLAKDSAKFRMEKEFMESERVTFYTDYDLALRWVRAG